MTIRVAISSFVMFAAPKPVERQIYLARWQLIVSVAAFLCCFVMVVLIGIITASVLKTTNTVNNILINIQNTGLIDDAGLLMDDLWFTVYPEIRAGVSLGYQFIQSANNNNVTALINGLINDASGIGRFIHNVLNIAANQYVAQQNP